MRGAQLILVPGFLTKRTAAKIRPFEQLSGAQQLAPLLNVHIVGRQKCGRASVFASMVGSVETIAILRVRWRLRRCSWRSCIIFYGGVVWKCVTILHWSFEFFEENNASRWTTK